MALVCGASLLAARGGQAARRFGILGLVAAGVAAGAGDAAGEEFEPALEAALDALEDCLADAIDLDEIEARLVAIEERHEAAFERIDDLCDAGERDAAERVWQAIRPDDWLSHEEAEHFARCLPVVEAQLLVDFPHEVARRATDASVHVCDGVMM